jgi:hypothetical protein
VALTLLSTEPSYALPPIRWYAPWETVSWRFERVPRARGELAEAVAQFEFATGRFGTGSRSVPVLFEVSNPESGASERVQAMLKDRLSGKFSFPASLIGEGGRLGIVCLGSPEQVHIGLRLAEQPLVLLQAPVPLEWGYAKAAALILAELVLIATMAATASTVVSAPVAVLVALATWFAGTTVGFVKEYVAAAPAAEMAHLGHAHALHQLGGWLGAVLNPFLRIEAVVLPDFARYHASPHILAGTDVPAALLRAGLTQTAVFVVAAAVAGWLLFRFREFR